MVVVGSPEIRISPEEKHGNRSGSAGNGQVPLDLEELKKAQAPQGWSVYLAGDQLGKPGDDRLTGSLDLDWRVSVINGAKKMNLPVHFTFPVPIEQARLGCGAIVSPKEGEKERAGAKINAIRSRYLLDRADVVVVGLDGDSPYGQWNAVFEAGQAVALGKTLIVLRDAHSSRMTREIDAAAFAVVHAPEKIVEILTYVISGQTP